jgi:hypothetical protein
VTIRPTPPRARSAKKKIRHRREVFAAVFETGVHAAHQYAVLQGRETEVERCEQVRVRRGGHIGSG